MFVGGFFDVCEDEYVDIFEEEKVNLRGVKSLWVIILWGWLNVNVCNKKSRVLEMVMDFYKVDKDKFWEIWVSLVILVVLLLFLNVIERLISKIKD